MVLLSMAYIRQLLQINTLAAVHNVQVALAMCESAVCANSINVCGMSLDTTSGFSLGIPLRLGFLAVYIKVSCLT